MKVSPDMKVLSGPENDYTVNLEIDMASIRRISDGQNSENS